MPSAGGESASGESKLDGEQRKALDALLSSTNAVPFFVVVLAPAKFCSRRTREQLQQTGRSRRRPRPQRQQVVDMEKAGLPSPSTVASFLLKHELVAGASLWWTRRGNWRTADARTLRAWLANGMPGDSSGDTRQHGQSRLRMPACHRAPFRREAREVHKIRRQDPALGRDFDERKRINQYRKAVESAAAGKLPNRLSDSIRWARLFPAAWRSSRQAR